MDLQRYLGLGVMRALKRGRLARISVAYRVKGTNVESSLSRQGLNSAG